jgi:hypothetical protein
MKLVLYAKFPTNGIGCLMEKGNNRTVGAGHPKLLEINFINQPLGHENYDFSIAMVLAIVFAY